MKQKKAKTKYTPDLCFAFVFSTNRLDPLEKPFYKLGLRVSSGFLNTPIQWKYSAAASFFHQFPRVKKPWWNSRLVYEAYVLAYKGR